MNQVVIIPALDPGNRLLHVVRDLQDCGLERIVVVDDGSASEQSSVFDILEQRGVCVVRHPSNLGKGAAIKSGLERARTLYPDAPAFVTCDSDGQHATCDVRRVAVASVDEPHSLVLGSRDFSGPSVPRRSRLGNALSARLFRFVTGIACADTQTGLRGIPASLAPFALSAPGQRFDYEMNFLLGAASAGVTLRAVPIQTIYAGSGGESHYRTVLDSLLIARGVLRHRFGRARSSCAGQAEKGGGLHALDGVFPRSA